MIIFIKKLRCQGTNRIVLEELKKVGVRYGYYEFGKIELLNELTTDQWEDLKDRLLKYGFQLKREESSVASLIRQAVNEVIENRSICGNNLPLYLSGRFSENYDDLNKIFRDDTGFSIEELFLGNSIEKRKRKKSIINKYRSMFNLVSGNDTPEYFDTQ